MQSAFGAGNIYGAAYTWDKANSFVKPFRSKYSAATWMDVKYEDLCHRPEEVLRKVCDFLGEEYSPTMLDFHKTPVGIQRGKQRDHAPLGEPVSCQYVGIYRRYLSIYEQEVYATIAGATHVEAGYQLDVEPIELSPSELSLMKEWDGRVRCARLDGPGGHIVFESYRDWLVDQRAARKERGIWKDEDDPHEFPAGHPDEEIIVGFRAWKKWKDHFNIRRRHTR
jgi:hypothetical protein